MFLGLVGAIALAAPVTPGLQVTTVEGTDVRFVHSRLVEVPRPTSLDFGPDDRLYVATLDGTLFAYTIERTGPGAYGVVATERIAALRDIVNHDRDGSPRPDLKARLVTGIEVVGSADAPVIYATSSDPRVGDKGETDLKIDNHSGVLSRLVRQEGAWVREDLVVGLPRSNEDHGPHGLVVRGDRVFVAQGGNTNMGAPSRSFFGLPETPWSAAILEVDLSALDGKAWDLRSGEPGPVSQFATGFRNPYDLAWTESGTLYVTDNGPNRTWGGVPDGCSERSVEGGETGLDTLHRVSKGTYAGHPNPSRSECRYVPPEAKRSAVMRFGTSTNGLVEYTASAFDGALKGDLLAASFSGILWWIPSDAPIGAPMAQEAAKVLGSGMGVWPLDVTTRGDDDRWPGTIWVAVHLTDRIQVFEPAPL